MLAKGSLSTRSALGGGITSTRRDGPRRRACAVSACYFSHPSSRGPGTCTLGGGGAEEGGTEALVTVSKGARLGKGGANRAVEGGEAVGFLWHTHCGLDGTVGMTKKDPDPEGPDRSPSIISKMKTNITFFTLAMGQREGTSMRACCTRCVWKGAWKSTQVNRPPPSFWVDRMLAMRWSW